MQYLPKARGENIVVKDIDKETLIYDLKINKVFSLNETSSIIYQACDGRTTFEELKLKTKFPAEIIFLALDELKRENLLDHSQPYHSPLSGISRREAAKKAGLTSIIALPIITSIIAPTAGMAQSIPNGQLGGFCSRGLDCFGFPFTQCCHIGPTGGTCSVGLLAPFNPCPPDPLLCCSGVCCPGSGGLFCC